MWVLACAAPASAADQLWAAGRANPAAHQPVTRDTFATLAARASPAVVNIFTTEHIRRRGLPLVPFSPLIPGLSYNAGSRTSLGTGFIIAPDGYILTNRHVIEDATTVQVHFQDGRTFPAQVVELVASRLDILLLKIEARDLPILPFADSETLRVGDWAVAIGNAFGLGHTVTTGVVSNLLRVTGVEVGVHTTHRLGVIQTDASINPGNSGGPLLNLDGHVIGINTATLSGSANIGFALDINTVKSQLPTRAQLALRPGVTHGVRFVLLTPEEGEAVYGDRTYGGRLKVRAVARHSPAARGGVRRADLLLRINGTPIYTYTDLQERLAAVAPGEPMEWDVRRKTRTFTVTVVGDPPPAD